MRHTSPKVLLFGTLAILASGCSEVGSSGPVPGNVRISSNLASVLVGTQAADLRARFGDPSEVRPYVVIGHRAEVWSYRYVVDRRVRYVSTSTGTTMMYSDPWGGGAVRPVEVPILTPEHTDVEETTSFILVDGMVASVRQYRSEHRFYD